jgi:RNA:NAD 2'-phosphotransferase (TPT1/KptA family)/8-oxo-dGTP pyrophosphatase MutT (NUDIX family)
MNEYKIFQIKKNERKKLSLFKKKMNYKKFVSSSEFSCAGFYILDPTGKLLLLGENEKGYLSPQKGGVEPIDDSLFKTAIRETMEESGVSIHELQFSEKEYIENAPSGKPNILYWCSRLKNTKTNFKYDQNELKSVKWYDIDQVLDPSSDISKRLKPQRLEILKQILEDLPTVAWEDDIKEKRFLRSNEKKKNPHDRDARAIVKLLRHDLDSQKIRYDPAGYVLVQDIIKKFKHLTLVKIQELVEYDNKYDKQRLDLKFDKVWKIRANQGHSLKNLDESKLLDELLEPLEFCLHLTEKKFLNSINSSGLSRMGRTHVHCVSKDPRSTDFKSVISGVKKQSNCYISIDMKASMESGEKWFVSKNDVVLTTGPILPEFFLGIIDLDNDRVIEF